MPWGRFIALILAFAMWSLPAHAGKMSTYIQGTVIKKTPAYWVVQTDNGYYWISVDRPVSYTTKISEIETGFWVQTTDIKRFRPLIQRASLD